MAIIKGIVSIEGTYEDMSFYKKDGKNFLRKKGGVSKERIDTDPNFVRTRENMKEFGQNISAGKMLRLALGSLVFKAKDSKLSNRLMQVMSRIKNFDLTSARGHRNVGVGIATAEGKLALTGFDFNANAPLQGVLFSPYALDLASGKVTIANLVAAEQLQFPQGATHLSLQSGVLAIDFSTGDSELVLSNLENLPINLTGTAVNLLPASMPSGGSVQLYLLFISFYQEVNGVQYSLKNESFNVLNVLAVA